MANNVGLTGVVGIITVLVLIVVGFQIAVAMWGTTLDSYSKSSVTSNYATDFSADRVVNFTLSSPALVAGSLSVAFDNAAGVSNVTVGGVTTALSSSPQSVAVSGDALDAAVLHVVFDVASGENVTDVNLTYTQYSGCDAYYDLCESANQSQGLSAAGFSVIPIVLVVFAAVAVITALASMKS